MEVLSSWRELFAKIIFGTFALVALALLFSLLFSPLSTGLSSAMEAALLDALVPQTRATVLAISSALAPLFLFAFLLQGLSLSLPFLQRLLAGFMVIAAVVGVDRGWVSTWGPLGIAALVVLIQSVRSIRFLVRQQEVLLLYRRGNVLRELESELKRFSLVLAELVGAFVCLASLGYFLFPREEVAPVAPAGGRSAVFVVAIEGLTHATFAKPDFLRQTKAMVRQGGMRGSLVPGSSEKLPRWVEYLTGSVAVRWGISRDGVSRLPWRWREGSLVPRSGRSVLVGDWSAAFLHRFPLGFHVSEAPEARFEEVLQAIIADNLCVAGTLTRRYRFGERTLSHLRSEAQTVLSRTRRRIPPVPSDGSLLFVSLLSSKALLHPELDDALARHLKMLEEAGWLEKSHVAILGDVANPSEPGVLALSGPALSEIGNAVVRGVDVAPTLASLWGGSPLLAVDGRSVLADPPTSRRADGFLPSARAFWEGFAPDSPVLGLVVDPLDGGRFVAAPGPLPQGALKLRRWMTFGATREELTVPAAGVSEALSRNALFGELRTFLAWMGASVVETANGHTVFVEADPL